MTEEYSIPNDDQISGEDIEPEADLSGADLSGAKIKNADLSGSNLSGCNMVVGDFSKTDFSGANLEGADLTAANLTDVVMCETNLRRATLSESCCENGNFQGADLLRAECFKADFAAAKFSEANLIGAVLTEALLPEADFTDASIREITLYDAKVSRGTMFDNPRKEISIKNEGEDDVAKRKKYDIIARTNHELKNVYSENGLVSEARKSRFRERKARRNEAFSTGGIRGYLSGIGSIFSMIFTGYGVRLRWVVAVMAVLLLGSAFVYHQEGMSLGQSLYYSVVTFTTSPPSEPSSDIMKVLASIETFTGTASIIFLGYVLGAREQV